MPYKHTVAHVDFIQMAFARLQIGPVGKRFQNSSVKNSWQFQFETPLQEKKVIIETLLMI